MIIVPMGDANDLRIRSVIDSHTAGWISFQPGIHIDHRVISSNKFPGTVSDPSNRLLVHFYHPIYNNEFKLLYISLLFIHHSRESLLNDFPIPDDKCICAVGNAVKGRFGTPNCIGNLTADIFVDCLIR